MSQKWYWMRDGKEHGPIEIAEIGEFAKNGQLKRTDLLWQEGARHKWFPAMEVDGLFPDQTSAAPTASLPTDTDATRATYLSSEAEDDNSCNRHLCAKASQTESSKCRICGTLLIKAPKWVIPFYIKTMHNTVCRARS